MSWICSCGLVNGGTNKYCAGLQRNSKQGHEQVSNNTPDWIMSHLAAKELDMTSEEELYAKFFSHEKVLVKDMDQVELREHRDVLQKIAFEAKARLGAIDDEMRERKAKAGNKQWLVTDAPKDYNVISAINVVKTRQSRMTKADKLRQQLKDIAHLDDATIEQMIGKVEKRATDSTLKTITFKVPSVELKSVQVESSNSEPFDPTDLKFGS